MYVHYSKIQIMNFPTPGKKHTDRHTPSRHSHWWWPIRNEFGSHVMPGICSMPVTHEAQSRRNRGKGYGVHPSQILADQLTLFKPGGQIVPLTLLPAPPPGFKKLSTPLVWIPCDIK